VTSVHFCLALRERFNDSLLCSASLHWNVGVLQTFFVLLKTLDSHKTDFSQVFSKFHYAEPWPGCGGHLSGEILLPRGDRQPHRMPGWNLQVH